MKLNRTAREFGRDLGADFQRIVTGDSAALAVLAERCHVDISALREGTVTQLAERQFEVLGHPFPRESLLRARIMVCPECIREDIEGDYGRLAPFGRVQWQIESYRACLKHRCLLAEADPDHRNKRLHDFAWHIRNGAGSLQPRPSVQVSDGDLALTRYIQRTLDGIERHGWLATMPLYAAARTCEMVGLAMRNGVGTLWQTVADHEWLAAGAEGYEFLREGPARLLEWFRELREAAPAGNVSQATVYGRIHPFLGRENTSDAFEPVRALLREHIIETTSLAKGERVLGKPLDERRKHSIRSAGLDYGINATTLRKWLIALGVIEQEAAHLPNDQILFDAAKNAPELETLSKAIYRGAAARQLGLTTTTRGILNPPFINPIGHDIGRPIAHVFAQDDVAAFLSRLTIGTLPLQPSDTGFSAVGATAALSKRPIPEIVSAVLAGQLKNLRLDPKYHGLAAVMVDVAEVKAKLTPPMPLLTLAMVKAELRCSIEAARDLTAGKHLAFELGRLPGNNQTVRLVRPEAVEAFLATYVSLFSLARELGRHFKGVKNQLRRSGISSVFGDDVAATFYRRSDVIPRLLIESEMPRNNKY